MVQHEKRLAILLHPPVQQRVAVIAREHKLSQSEVIEVLVDLANTTPNIAELFATKRESKVNGRTGKTALLKKLSKLSAEDLAALAMQLEAQK